jgi:hypothetical protein
VSIGVADVPANQEQALFTLNWPGSRLDPILTDPSGRSVGTGYTGATISTSNTLATILISNPMAGKWQIAAVGADVPEGNTSYSAIFSTRQGNTAVPQSGMEVFLIVAVVAGGGLAAYVLSRRGRTAPQRAACEAHLRGLSGEMAGIAFTLADGYQVGRGSGCQILLSDPAVSRIHTRFRYAGGAWYVQDQRSDGGTFLNGMRIRATAVHSGDHIQIGSSEFIFEE